MLAFRRIVSGLALLALVTALSAPASADSVVTDDDSKWLIGDADVIVKFNFKQMLASEMLKKDGVDDLKKAIASNEQIKAIVEAAGLDVGKDFDSVLTSGVLSSPADVKMRVVVRGRFDPEKIQAALKKREEIKVAKAGETTLFEVPVQDKAVFAAFADKNTLVLTQDKDATLDAVKTGGKNAAKLSKDMQTALAKFSGKESMAMALVVNEKMKEMITAIPRFGEAAAKLNTLTAGVTISNKVEFAVRGITGDAKSANQLSKLLEAGKAFAAAAGADLPPGVEEIVNAVKLGSDKESVKIDLEVTKEMIDKASKGG